MKKIKYYCRDCQKEIHYSTSFRGCRCRSCASKQKKGNKSPTWTGGKPKCIDCKKSLSNYKVKRCKNCFLKLIIKFNYCKDCKKEISLNAKRCGSCASKIRSKGINNSNYKNGKPKCQDCGKTIRYVSKRCEKCNKKYMIGINATNYIHGRGYDPYPLEFNEQLKYKIRTRDNFECQICHMTEEEHFTVYGTVLCVHHIDYDKNNCKDYNLTSLCNGCNIRVNFNREYWQKYIIQKIGKWID